MTLNRQIGTNTTKPPKRKPKKKKKIQAQIENSQTKKHILELENLCWW